MADAKAKKTPAKKPAKGGTTKKSAARKAAPKKTAATSKAPDRIEAKSRFNTALEEAKAGAASLRAEAGSRGEDMMSEAKVYGQKAKDGAYDIASQGKTAASDAISSLGKVVGDTAEQIDERFGEQYGDYARKASRTLAETSASLDSKTVEDIGEDAREFVRKSPGVAIGIAAVAGFIVARMLRGSRD